MHEVGITRSLIEIAERHAREEGARRVVSVTVAVGALSGVVPEAVEFCFEACSKGTFLEGAQLVVERIPGKGRCGGCGAAIDLDPHTFACPACGALGPERLAGEELKITELEID